MKSKGKNLVGRESVKLSREIVERVREFKKESMVSIGGFFEKAAMEKLDREFVKSKK